MKLLISPAKKMREDTDFLAPKTVPALLEQSRVLAEWLKGLDYPALKKLLSCSDAIAELNFRRYQEMDFGRAPTPALLSYDGIQYQYMAPQLFTRAQFAYVEEHLRILSGLYGVLRPFDGVTPYRLEMGARLKTPFCKSLYDFWPDELAYDLKEAGFDLAATANNHSRDQGMDGLYRTLTADGTDTLVNLASEEYARAVRPWVSPPVRWIRVVFGELDGERLVEKGVYVKMARGEMVRFLAERGAETPEAMKDFDRMGYAYAPERSDGTTYVFLRENRPGR